MIQSVEIRNNFLQVIHDVTRIPKSGLRCDTRLLHDLGIDGDDAWELLETLRSTFDIDIRGFEFHDYFFSEAELTSPLSLVSALTGWLGIKTADKKKKDLRPLTIRRLYRVCRKRRWQSVAYAH